MYERGYARFFDLPYDLIEITLTRLLVAGAAGVSVVVSILMLAQIVWPLVVRNLQKEILGRLVFILFIAALTGVVVNRLFHDDLQAWVLFFTLFGFILVLTFGPPLIFRRRGTTYAERFRAHDEETRQEEQFTLHGAVGRRFGPLRLTAVWTFATVALMAEAAGNYQAAHETEYYVLADRPDRVVLRIYGGTLVTASIDRKLKVIHPGFELTSAQSNAISMRKEPVGALKLESPKPVVVAGDKK
jgi:hypothetical protein